MKAILILEMPETCLDCPFNRDYMCLATLNNEFGVWGGYVVLPEKEKPYWCPLKEMPSKIAVEDIDEHTDPLLVKMGYVNGWNECLEEIEK